MDIILGLGLSIVFTVFMVSLFGFVFWIWLILDCIQRDFREPMMKVVWIVLMIALPLIGSLLYFFLEKYPADKQCA